LVDKVQASGLGCQVNMACLSVLLYADDIQGGSKKVSHYQMIKKS